MSNPEATLEVKKRLKNLLINLCKDNDTPTEDEIDEGEDLCEIIWEVLDLRVLGISEVSGLINLAVPLEEPPAPNII